MPDLSWLINVMMHGESVNAMVLTEIDSGDVTEVESFVAWLRQDCIHVKLFDHPEHHLQVNGEWMPLGEDAPEEVDYVFYIHDHLRVLPFVQQTIE